MRAALTRVRALGARVLPVDDFHLSPCGSLLAAAVLHWTIFDEGPSASLCDEPARLFERARFMQPRGDPAQPLPTAEEASYLLSVAARIAAASVC